MESINLEMEDFFEDAYRNLVGNEDIGNTEADNVEYNMEDDKVLSDLEKLAKGAKKKQARQPQPKLDIERLKSSKGLTALAGTFKDVQFRGEGYEYDDLNTLMLLSQHWAHRLMPNLTFIEFIDKLEKLGGKKEVQTLIKRIRLDMLPHEEAENNDEQNMEVEEELRDLDAIFGPSKLTDLPDPVSLRQSAGELRNSFEEPSQDEDLSGDRDTNSMSTNFNGLDSNLINDALGTTDKNDTCGNTSHTNLNNSPGNHDNSINSSISDLTNQDSSCSTKKVDDLKERMERNRLLALEKRMHRLSKN